MTRNSGMIRNWGRCAHALIVATAASTAACDSGSTKANGASGGGGAAGIGGSAGASAMGGGGGVAAGTGGAAGAPGGGDSVGTADFPPMGAAAVEAWLQAGSYKRWTCEGAIHAARSPSPHGFNRICSNLLVSGNAEATTAWPKGAAAVKELYASAADTTPIGYAVYAKTKDDSGAGANWYWYERVPLDSAAPHDASGVVADGMGSTGPAMQICVGCHGAAGADAAHTPSVGGRDQVYTPVSAAAAANLPPMGAAAVEAWLQTGQYKNWHCERAVHSARSPSPHGFNRICSNDVIAAHARETGAWPKGAAAVKELFAAAGDTSPIGYAVYSKTGGDSAAGANWYWYERVPLDSAAPHDAAGVVADGPGSTGPAMQICVGCHAASGSDAAHTPSAGGRDQVYTPVM